MMVSRTTIFKALHVPSNIHVEIMARDLFALGCKLHADGDREAGYKAISTAMTGAGGVDDETQLRIYRSLAGNEATYASYAKPHSELSTYLKSELAGFTG
jgi:hypothetical protein